MRLQSFWINRILHSLDEAKGNGRSVPLHQRHCHAVHLTRRSNHLEPLHGGRVGCLRTALLSAAGDQADECRGHAGGVDVVVAEGGDVLVVRVESEGEVAGVCGGG